MDKKITDGPDESLRQYFADHEITVPPPAAREEEPEPAGKETPRPYLEPYERGEIEGIPVLVRPFTLSSACYMCVFFEGWTTGSRGCRRLHCDGRYRPDGLSVYYARDTPQAAKAAVGDKKKTEKKKKP